MSYAAIHPNWERPAHNMVDGYSLEMTAKEIGDLRSVAPLILPETQVAITFLPGEEVEQRILASQTARELGFEPIAHVSARRLKSESELDYYLRETAARAGARRIFVVAGDPPQPEGPYEDSLQIIESGLLEKYGFDVIGIGGHPQGHPNVPDDDLWLWMERKLEAIRGRGMIPLVVTQFGFDDDAIVDWLSALRARGIDVPVRLGVPGPAGIRRLLGFARRCGVGASAAVMKKYGVSLTNLVGNAGPDRLVASLEEKLGPEHGRVRLHFYPIGALKATVEWINAYDAAHR